MQGRLLAVLALAGVGLAAPGAAGSFVYTLPAAAHSSGVAGTAWRTELQLFNPSARDEATASVVYVPYTRAGGTAQLFVTVPPRGLVVGEDIVTQLLGSGAGYLQVTSDHPLVVGQRTFNVAAAGSLGQYVPPLQGSAESQYLVGMLGAPEHRTNLGFVNLMASPVAVFLDLPAELGLVLPGRTGKQLNRVELWPGFDGNGSSAVVRASGSTLGYASVVETATGEAVFVPGGGAMRSGVVTGLTHREDGGGVAWQSDLYLFAPNEDSTVTVTLLPSGAGGGVQRATRVFAVSRGQTRVVADVVRAIAPDATGPAAVSFEATAPVAISARSHVATAAGEKASSAWCTDTMVSGVEAAFVFASRSPKEGEGPVSSLWLVNGGESRGTFDVSVIGEDGVTLGQTRLEVGARAAVVSDDIVAAVGLDGLAAGVVAVSGDQPFTGHLSVVDRSTGSALTVPPQAVRLPLLLACGASPPQSGRLSGVAPLTGTLVAMPSGGVTPVGLKWDFGDSTPEVAQDTAQHTWTEPGTYTARAVATDATGDQATCTVLVEVAAPPPPPVISSFGATPSLVQVGEPVTLVWQTANATTVTIAPGVGAVAPSGSLAVTPGSSTTYTLQASGPGGLRAATVAVTVNHPPVAVADTASTDSGVETVLAPLKNDSDPDGDTLGVCGLSGVSLGHAAVQGSTQIVYGPPPGYTGTASFAYKVCDGKGGTAWGQVTVTMVAVPNRPPVAVADSVVIAYGAVTVIPVALNDRDPDGDVLTVVAVTTAPAHGTAAIVGTTSVRYTPAAGFVGQDSFTYQVDDGHGHSARAPVTVTVEPRANTAPVLSNFSPPNDTKVTVGTKVTVPFAVGVADADGDTLHWSVAVTSTAGATVEPVSGTVPGGAGTVSFSLHTGNAEHGARVVVTVTDSFGGVAVGTWILDCL